MPNSSVFIFLMLRALYRMICKNAKSCFGKNSLNVSNVKLFFFFFFNVFGFFMPFWWEWQLALYILSDFPGIKILNGLYGHNSLNNLNSLISSKKTLFKRKKNVYFWWFVTFYYLKKAPKSQNIERKKYSEMFCNLNYRWRATLIQ